MFITVFLQGVVYPSYCPLKIEKMTKIQLKTKFRTKYTKNAKNHKYFEIFLVERKIHTPKKKFFFSTENDLKTIFKHF